MKIVSLRAAALAGAAAIAAVLTLPATAHAAITPGQDGTSAATRTAPQTSGSGEGTGTEPTMYIYGTLYDGSVINPPASVPASAVITDVCWTWNYTYPHPASGIWIYVADEESYFSNTSGNEVGCSTADNGQPASQEFEVVFESPGGTSTYRPPILPPAAPSGPYTVTVYYSF